MQAADEMQETCYEMRLEGDVPRGARTLTPEAVRADQETPAIHWHAARLRRSPAGARTEAFLGSEPLFPGELFLGTSLLFV